MHAGQKACINKIDEKVESVKILIIWNLAFPYNLDNRSRKLALMAQIMVVL